MSIEADSKTPLAAAVRKAGSQSAFGRLIGKRQSVIHDWLSAGKDLPAEHVLNVEQALGLSRHFLRPDIYPEDLPPAPANADSVEEFLAA